MRKIRIACSFGGRIKAGRITKDRLSFSGEPEDVTSDCLKAVIDYVGIDKTHVITVDGKPLYEIEVRNAVPPTEQQEARLTNTPSGES